MYFDFKTLGFSEKDVHAEKLAIAASDRSLTWSEFEKEACQTAEKLKELKLPEGHPVVIYGHKEANFLVSMAACMMLRLPYIPVDTIYPTERMLKISRTVGSAVTIYASDGSIHFAEENRQTAYPSNDPTIYIIFTSGSTGEPKGVQITQSAIVDFSRWLGEDFGFAGGKIFMNQAPFSFDLSVYELVGFLSFGGSIVLNSRDLIENDHLAYFDRVKQFSVDTWVSTPSFIARFLMSEEFVEEKISKLKQFLFCGEVLPALTAKRILRNFPNGTVVNSYGPTEATVATTRIEITEDIADQFSKSLPVGYAKPRTELRLLDRDEDGVGEIQIIGDNVSIGYFANEQLNKEKFGFVEGKRSFRTGDFGFFKDGMLFFANRKDELIKLHGFRIELGEIDRELTNQPNVREAITVPLKRGNEVVKLVSFALGDSEIDTDSLKDGLSEKLPHYMIPSDIVVLSEFPYNNSHKIDKKALVEIYRNR